MSGEPRVLVVDDDEGMVEVIATILEPLGMALTTTVRGADALRLLGSARFDLVVSDLAMPGVDGHDLIQVLRQRGDHTPVLFLSGSGKAPDIVKLMRAGAAGYLEKPFEPADLKREVLAALAARPAPSAPVTTRIPVQAAIETIELVGPRVPPKLGRYELRDSIAAGGMGRVYRGYDPHLDREVAIKVLRIPETPDAQSKFPSRFRREAVALAKLKHPHIVDVYDCDIDPQLNAPYVVMELVEGESLAALLAREGKLPIERALDLALEIADALAFAHELGIVHRDVKPDNILVDRAGRARLIDFGIARVDDSNLTMGASILGTPNYLSPEAARMQPIDARADQFSLATVILEMITAHQPFRAPDPAVTIFNVCEEAAPSLETLGVPAPSTLQTLLTRMHAKDPTARFDTDAALRSELAAVRASLPRA